MSTDSVLVFSGLTPKGLGANVRLPGDLTLFRPKSCVFDVRARITGRSGRGLARIFHHLTAEAHGDKSGLAVTLANTAWRPLETTSPDHAPEARGGTAEPCATVVPRGVRRGSTYSD